MHYIYIYIYIYILLHYRSFGIRLYIKWWLAIDIMESNKAIMAVVFYCHGTLLLQGKTEINFGASHPKLQSGIK